MWTLSSSPIWETGAEKRLVQFYYITITTCILVVVYVAVVVDDDTSGLLVLRPSISSLLQSSTAYFIKSAVVCYYKVRQVLLQSATIFITKCDRTDSVALKALV